MPRLWTPISVKDPYNLDKGLLRMSWNRFNTFNLFHKSLPDLSRMTVFQQRWIAKRELRAYHVPNISQKQFLNRHFTSQLPFQKLTRAEQEKLPPVQALCFAELERRLDVIVFRSHFARSIFHARHAVSAGKVFVNGVKCTLPAWRIEDGDLITVDPSTIPTLKSPPNNQEPGTFEKVTHMDPWMFTPAYLEVDYNTCSTVFLRSPLPQPERMEIPSPYPPSWHQLAFDWYNTLKKSKKIRIFKPLVLNGQHVRLKPKFDRMVRRKQKIGMRVKKVIA
jgi:ribosomal protein S4